MSGFFLVLQILNGCFFAGWVVMVFRTLFGKRRSAAVRSGKAFPGPIDTLREWQHW